MAVLAKSSRWPRRRALYPILTSEMRRERLPRQRSIADGLGLESEVGHELGACRPPAIHEAQVQTRRYFAQFVADVAPHERSAGVIHDHSRPAIEPARPVADPGLDGLQSAPLVDK